MIALFDFALAQSDAVSTDEVSSDTGVVLLVGFILIGIVAVIAAAQYRKRRG